MLIADGLALPSCASAAAWLVTARGFGGPAWVMLVPPAAGLAALNVWGFYRSVVRFMSNEVILATAYGVTLTSGAFVLPLGLLQGWTQALRIGAVFWLLATIYVAGSRIAVGLILRARRVGGERVVIYGAGEAGARLAALIASRGEFTLLGFVDDNPALHGAVVNGVEVHSRDALRHFVDEFGLSRVLLALPSASRRRRQEIIGELERLPLHVQTVPDVNDLIAGKARVDEIREVDIADLLGRDPVPPIPELLGACITGKRVMVTGAGGSIGSELCLQIARLRPSVLVLLELSEAALYTVEQTLVQLIEKESLDTRVVALLGSVLRQGRMRELMSVYGVQTIYHAAAYKHVPLVELNMIEGIQNNVFGTLHLAEAAVAAGVESFVLISTDKAVKPTSVMGATKRCAELVLQSISDRQTRTRFSIVRFGNVLASSGSVIPLFREQIRCGGPVTVTHPDVYRYFMTIPEAASLVLQAGSMATGGDVFVLDMGPPIRISDLAAKMIHLMGLGVRDEAHPDGEVELAYIGLRPGEKLHEELLIGDNVTGTEHRRIMRAEEDFLHWGPLQVLLAELRQTCRDFDCVAARRLLRTTVCGYSPGIVVEDAVWREQGSYAAVSAPSVGGKVAPISLRRSATGEEPA